MSGPSKQPHNAGQTVIVQQISSMPVSDMDCGPITITENWGRLFIRWNGQEIIALMGHYPKLVEAIQHFIEPATRTPDPAQIRADAIREAADCLRSLGYNTAVRAILALIDTRYHQPPLMTVQRRMLARKDKINEIQFDRH